MPQTVSSFREAPQTNNHRASEVFQRPRISDRSVAKLVNGLAERYSILPSRDAYSATSGRRSGALLVATSPSSAAWLSLTDRSDVVDGRRFHSKAVRQSVAGEVGLAPLKVPGKRCGGMPGEQVCIRRPGDETPPAHESETRVISVPLVSTLGISLGQAE